MHPVVSVGEVTKPIDGEVPAVDVVIFGDGPAGCCTAVHLLRYGLTVALAGTPAPPYDALEAIALSALRVADDSDLAGVFAGVRANAFGKPSLLYRRGNVAARMRELARSLGARSIDIGACGFDRARAVPRMPAACGVPSFVVDATGCAARLSETTAPEEHLVADLWRIPSSGIAGGWSDGASQRDWSYTIDDGTCATFARIGPRASRAAPPHGQRLARRPAHASWAAAPVLGKRLSVGDAAVAHPPITGSGMRWALSGARAAAAAIATALRYPQRREIALRYYENAVAREVAALRREGRPPRGAPAAAASSMQWAVEIVQVPQYENGWVVLRDALRPYGTNDDYRYAGGVDLVALRTGSPAVVDAAALARALGDAVARQPDADRLFTWLCGHGLLRPQG